MLDKNNTKIISFRKILHETGRPVRITQIPGRPNKISKTPIIIPQRPAISFSKPITKPPIALPITPTPMVKAPPIPPRINNPIKSNRPIIKPKGPNNALQKDTDKISSLKGIGTGRILIMIAAGPTVLEVDFTSLLNHPLIDIMCINKSYKPVWQNTKYWAFCDHTQYNRNQDAWSTYTGIIINSPNVTARRSNQIVIKSKGGRGFSKDMNIGYHIGRSSTYANMQVALYMNYERIYIFGLDMAKKNGILHHYGTNPDCSPENREKRFSAEAESYTYAGQNLPEDIRKRFYICSSINPWDFCKYYNKMDHLTAVPDIKKYADEKLPKS